MRRPDGSSRCAAPGRSTVHGRRPFVFQVQGLEPGEAAAALAWLTDAGHVPEALRLASLIGAAVQTGTSGRRA